MTIAGGICAALLGRERTGEGMVVDVSLLATGMWAIGAGVALPRFATHEDLTANAREAAGILQEVFLTRTAAQWQEQLRDFRGQWALVQDTGDLAADPQVQADGYLVRAQTASGAPFSLVATPVQFDGESAATERAPEYNEHGDGILTDLLGYDWDAVIDLKVKGAVG